MKSVMKHDFSKIPKVQIPRSQFNRSHGHKTTFDAGWLVPFYTDEALPGDTFNLNCANFARLATPINPYMDNVFLDTFFFAVPIRLVWDNWQKFNGEQTNPTDSTDFLIPTMNSGGGSGYANGTLYDYMGLPTQVTNMEHSALFTRAYNLIYNEWFRDQNLQDSAVVDKGDGPDDVANYSLLKRGKRHDYFTSCLPWPQKGESVDIPLGTTAPVVTNGADPLIQTLQNEYPLVAGGYDANINGRALLVEDLVTATRDPVQWGEETGMQADLSQATAATINSLRQAFQIQKLYEKDARGGTRYTEIIRSHFGVTSPDQRLQRPEYLGGGTQNVTVNPVPSTVPTDLGASPQGNLAAYATSSSAQHGFTKSFTEHCIIIGIVSARADLTYQQGLDRKFSRKTRWDFYWPSLAHIGEQAVLNKEIYADGTAADEDVFGYQERFAEYRYFPSKITGQFRSNYSATLDSWHLAQDFGNRPVLNEEFIEEDPPFDRIVAVPTEPDFIFDSYINIKTARPMPMYGVPGLIDHF